jgi:hypothetical protein
MSQTSGDILPEQSLNENGSIIKDNKPKVKWTAEHERILVDWADKALCYRWLHGKAHERYSKLNTWFTIPVIIMSTLTGTANFAQEQVPADFRGFYPMIIGSVNLIAGIISTIQQYLKVAPLNEAHRVATISWDKFYRNIKTDLARSPSERVDVKIALKVAKEEYDRLTETSPVIPKDIVEEFKLTFHTKLTDAELLEKESGLKKLSRPEILDALETTATIVYVPHEEDKDDENLQAYVESKIKLEESIKVKKLMNFIESFKNKYAREPTNEEILENLQDQIQSDFIVRYLNKQKNQSAPLNSENGIKSFRNAIGLVQNTLLRNKSIDDNNSLNTPRSPSDIV